MKGFALAVALVLALPLAAFAHSTCLRCQPYINSNGVLIGPLADPSFLTTYNHYIDFQGGTLTGTDAGMTLTGSVFTGAGGVDLGTVTMTTGGLLTGSLQSGATFSSAGSSLIVTVNPDVYGGILRGGGILFKGSFVEDLNWTPVPDHPGLYILQGFAVGNWATGRSGQAWVILDLSGSVNSNGVFTPTSISGQAVINPEPGTLGLFVTGLIGMGGAVRRKLRV